MNDRTHNNDEPPKRAHKVSRDLRAGRPFVSNGGSGEFDAEPAQRGASAVWEIGSVIANRYVLQNHLGRGRYGEIYCALDRSLSGLGQEHHVALHLLHERVRDQSRLLERLENSTLQPESWAHPNIVKVLGFGRDHGKCFLVMELLEGASLRFVLDDAAPVLLSKEESFAILRSVGDALKYAHAKGAVHGDVRPEKVFVTSALAVKVLDLLPASAARTVPFFVEDTSPNGLVIADRRDDVYGLACVAYELLSGRHPFNANSPLEALRAGFAPPPLTGLSWQRWEALAQGLALNREQRTPSVAQFLEGIGVTGLEQLRLVSSEQAAAAPAPDLDIPILVEELAPPPAKAKTQPAQVRVEPPAPPPQWVSAPQSVPQAPSPQWIAPQQSAPQAPPQQWGVPQQSATQPAAPQWEPPQQSAPQPPTANWEQPQQSAPQAAPPPAPQWSAPQQSAPPPQPQHWAPQQQPVSQPQPQHWAPPQPAPQTLDHGPQQQAAQAPHYAPQQQAVPQAPHYAPPPLITPQQQSVPPQWAPQPQAAAPPPPPTPPPAAQPQPEYAPAPKRSVRARGEWAHFDVRPDTARPRPEHAPRTRLWLVAVLFVVGGVAAYLQYEPFRSGANDLMATASTLAANLVAKGIPRKESTTATIVAAEDLPTVVTDAPAAPPTANSDAPADALAGAPASALLEPLASASPYPATVIRNDASMPPREAAAVGETVTVSTAGASQPAYFAFADDYVTISEGQAVAPVVIRRLGDATEAAAVVWWTSDGTASADNDYATFGARVEKFAPGEQERTIHIPIVVDSVAESRESFYVNLSSSESRARRLEASAKIEVSIVDDDF